MKALGVALLALNSNSRFSLLLFNNKAETEWKVIILIGSLLDIFLFGVFKRMTGDRFVWFRATGSTSGSPTRRATK